MNIPPLSLGLSKGVEALRAADSEFFSAGQAHGLLCKAGAHTPVHALSGRLQAGPNGGIELTVPASLIKGVFDALHEPGAEFVVRNNRTESAIKVMTKAEVEKLGGQDKVTERGHSYNYTLGPIVELPASGGYEKLWAISIDSDDLKAIRGSYGLETSPQLGFYIPVGIKKNNVTKDNGVSKLAETELPWRDRVEVYAQNPKGKVYGGVWDSDKSFALPGGGIDAGEDPLVAALRELKEETGITAKNPRLLPVGPVDNPWSDAHRAKTKRNFAGSRTHFVLADADSNGGGKNLDVWNASNRRYYTPAEAIDIMNKNTNYMAPAAAEARLKALQHLHALASKGATGGNL
jgi:8-oxo-dGTP pyrophosphatase MutT (NUDIX family)